MASYTVNFSDGSSHTYDNVPEGVDKQNVQDRATMEFGDDKKKVVDVTSGEAPQQSAVQGMGTSNPNATIGQKVIAGGQTAVNMTGQALQSPIGHVAEAAIGGKYAFNKLADLAQQYGAAKGVTPPTPAPAPAPAPSPIITPQNTGGVPRPQMPTGNPAQTMDILRAPAPSAPTMPSAPPTPPVGGPAAAQAETFLQRMASQFGGIAQKVAPALQSAAESPVGRVAGGALRIAGSAPVVGAQLMSHSAPLGPQVPMSGPQRGSEINPRTGQPWTAQDLSQYNQQYK